jgi:hypothetical protein
MSRLSLRAPALALFAVLLIAGPAFAKVVNGTNGDDMLIGTKRKDQITGGGGQDLLKGKGGNDTYFFADNWGNDTLVETAKGGIDTLDFQGVSSDKVTVNLTPEWVSVSPSNNSASGPGGEVLLAYEANGQTVQSIVENVIGGTGDGDSINGGRGKNVLQPGGGESDLLLDFGGHDDGEGELPPIPVSNDIYKGFESNSGIDQIFDYGGQDDVLDMRPFESSDVSLTAFDFDNDPETEESLEIETSPTTSVVILGQFGEYEPFTTDFGYHGHIEKLIFNDVTYTDKNPPIVESTRSTEATRDKRTEMPASESLSAAEETVGEEIEAGTDVAPDTHQAKADKRKKGKR